MDVSDVLARGPVTDLGCLGVVGDAAFVSTFVAQNDHLRDCDEKFLCGDCSTGTLEAVENVVDIGEMFPDEPADEWVSGDGFVPAICCFIACRRPLDATVVHKGPGNVGDLRLQNKGDIFMEYSAGIGPT